MYEMYYSRHLRQKGNTMEHTKIIKEFPDYNITSTGRVFKRITTWRGNGGSRELIQTPNAFDYLRVTLVNKKISTTRFVHKLVAKAFLAPKAKGQQMRHLDGNKYNNDVSNLIWGTAKENAADREKHGHTSRGLKHSIAIKKGQERIGYNVKW